MIESGTPDDGVVVMAYGEQRFRAQAVDLARSLRLHCPTVACAVVTDRPEDRAFQEVFDHVVALPPDTPLDCRPKLDLDRRTPFRRTLYLDSDSLVFRDIRFVLDRNRGRDVVVLGRQVRDGRWYGDVRAMCRLAGAGSIPQFNGGVLYLADTPVTSGVFRRARGLAERYGELGLDTFNGGVADEPLLAMALAEQGIIADPRDADTSMTLLGLQGEPLLDMSAGRAEFVKNGRTVAPAVVHFAAEYSETDSSEGRYYRRLRACLPI